MTDISLAITIVILVILTLIIFAFAVIVFIQIYQSEKLMIAAGKRDREIIEDKEEQNSRSTKIATIVLNLFSYLLCGIAVVLTAFSLYVHFSGETFWLNGRSAIVIASNSMSKVADDDDLATNNGYLTTEMISQEFNRGDILYLGEKPTEDEMMPLKDTDGNYITLDNGSLTNSYMYKIFTYDYSGTTIVHRLYYIGIATDSSTGDDYVYYVFKGDNNSAADGIRVTYPNITGSYDGSSKIEGVGYFVLFFESLFGIYAVLSSIVMVTVSGGFEAKIQKQFNARYDELKLDRPELIAAVRVELAAPKHKTKLREFFPAQWRKVKAKFAALKKHLPGFRKKADSDNSSSSDGKAK
jgi:hypothetical protein